MQILSKTELNTLTQKPKKYCVSIFMATHQISPEIRQDPIRFKNLIKVAEEQLIEKGMRRSDVLELLQAAIDLDNPDFWHHQNRGLAIFISDNVFRYYRLPVDFQELVIVSDRFHLKPLLSLLNGQGHFYLLFLSQKDIKLFEGNREIIHEIPLENAPKSLESTLNYDNAGDFIPHHITTPRGGNTESFIHPGTFYGQGSLDIDDIKEDMRQFFHQINHALVEKLGNDNSPLILAGVEYLLPIYQEANSYPYLLEKGINGNIKIMQSEELHYLAWEIVEPYFQHSENEAFRQYNEIKGTGETSNDIREIVAAAYYQRVDTLFVTVEQQIWGNFYPENNAIAIHQYKEKGDEDLLDFAAIHTLLNGGKVFALAGDRVPDKKLMAAIFRY